MNYKKIFAIKAKLFYELNDKKLKGSIDRMLLLMMQEQYDLKKLTCITIPVIAKETNTESYFWVIDHEPMMVDSYKKYHFKWEAYKNDTKRDFINLVHLFMLGFCYNSITLRQKLMRLYQEIQEVLFRENL